MSDDDKPRPVLSLLFWLCLALALVCIGAGLAVDLYGPALFPVHAASSHALGKPPSPR